MTKNKTNLLILIVLTTLFVFTIGYSAWIIINVKEADTPLDYNYRDIVYSAYNGQSENYNHGEELQPNPEKNGYDLTIIDANTFTFKHRLKDITPTPEWTPGLPKNAGTYEILILSDNFSSTDEELIVTFTINPISPVKEYGPVIAFAGEDYNLIYTTFDGYNGTIGDPQYYDESNNLLSEKPKSKGNYTAKILFGESDNFKETLLEIPIVITDTINVDPSELSVTVNPENYTYTGSPITPTIEVTLNGSTLDSQYYEIINLQNNTNVGQASFTVNLKSGYEGTFDKTFIISPRQLTPMPLEISYVSTIRKFTDICNNQILNNTVDDSGNITGGLILVDAEDGTTQYKANGIVTITNMHDGRHGYGTFGTDDPIYEKPANVYGSTYIVKLAVSDTNYSLKDDTFILKYKTVLIDSNTATYYTIEDAFSKATSKIWFAGDATNTSSYVVTSFTSLFDLYSNKTSYELKVPLIVPYKNSASTTLTKNKETSSSGTSGNVYSAFIIPQNMTINITNGGIAVGAAIGYGQGLSPTAVTTYTTAAKNRGVLVNDGIINVSKGSIYTYGYIKGNGAIYLSSGTTMLEAMTIYDWPGGSASSQIYSDLFPVNCWSIRNNICETHITLGATYQGWVNIAASGFAQDISCYVIGNTSSSNCLFKPIENSSNGEIIKSVISDDETLVELNKIETYNQTRKINVFDLIQVLNGQYTDMALSLKKLSIEMSTSLEKALPVSYMNIIVCSGASLELSSSDYLFLPGTSATIESGGEIIVGENVDITFVDRESYYAHESEIPTEAARIKYSQGWFKDEDAYFTINGKLTVKGKIGGKLVSTLEGAIIDLQNGLVGSYYKSLLGTAAPYYCSDGPIKSWGKIYPNEHGYFEEKNEYVYSGEFWLKTKGTITYVTNGSNEACPLNNITFTSNGYTLDSLPIITKTGYEFKGWYLDNEYSILADNLTIYDSVTLYALWQIKLYDITFDSNNGEEAITSNIEYNSKVNEPSVPIRDGYIFNGWYDNNGIKMIFPFNMPDRDLILTAQWVSEDTNTYTINFNVNGGTSVAEMVVEEGAFINPDTLVSTRNGYTLSGWNYEGSPFDFSQPINSDMELEAVWELVTYKITYHVNGGQLGETYITSYNIESSAFDLPTPTKTSYNFKGWYTTSDFSNDQIIQIAQGTFGDIVLYAKWTGCIVTYNANEGSCSTGSHTYAGEPLSLPTPTRDGYTFNGWYTAGSGGTKVGDAGATYTPDGDITLYAQWTKESSGGCLAEGTLITMADGTKKKVEDLVYGDKVLVFNHETGKFEISTLIFNAHKDEPISTQDVVNLYFSNGVVLRIVAHHGIFDLTLNEYVEISKDNIDDFIGHEFSYVSYVNGQYVCESVFLNDYVITEEYIKVYSPITANQINCFAEGFLTTPGLYNRLMNIFEYDDNMTIDIVKKQKDIDKYGLYDYSVFEEYVSYEIYQAFNGQYFKVAVEKGIITLEEIIQIILDFNIKDSTGIK